MRRAMRRPMGVNRTVAIADVRRSGGGVRDRRRVWVRVNISVFLLLVHDLHAFFTRKRLRDVSLDVATYVYSHARRISDIASHECRSKDIRQNTTHVKLLLNNILLEYDPEGRQWAQTDGTRVWLNTWRQFDDDTLFWTILHEVVHGMFTRARGGHELSESLEHRIMEGIDRRMV